ncbi:hypothetical protein [Elioraea tepidiphila]|jgi:hypothetical protein|uniref:hypothetical protein n=1 Tax=Elioraea tepidiphila TaxID=457934 RepID=UPI002FDA2E34
MTRPTSGFADQPWRSLPFPHVTLAGHADWSSDPRKCWIAVAGRDAEGRWTAKAPVPVGPPGSLAARLTATAAGGAAVLGLDVPLGLPRLYAERHAGAPDFPAFLRTLAGRPSFFAVAATLEEVSPDRPFYPARGARGMTRAAHAAALGLPDPSCLGRRCDLRTATRPAGAPLFWTLGANQAGKAAIHAWREMLLPALAEGGAIRLWPFEGTLAELARPGALVLAETYPAECYRHIGVRLAGSKRRRSARLAAGAALIAWARDAGVTVAPDLAAAIADGFGADAAGEDRFDCVCGLFGVLNVLLGRRAEAYPDDPALLCWEGWVLGQTDQPLAAQPA